MWSNRRKNLSLNNFIQGSAKGEGECFFDSVAQGLKQILQNQEFTIKSMREDCYDYVLNHANDIWNTHMSLKEIIAQDALAGGYGKIGNSSVGANFNNYLAGIRLTAEDVKTIGHKYTTIWGRPEIEGRIICAKYNVKLHVIEKHKIMEEEIWTKEIIDGSGSKSCEVIDYNDDNIIHIINIGNNHFTPLLCKPQDELLSSHNQVISSNEHSIIDQVQKNSIFQSVHDIEQPQAPQYISTNIKNMKINFQNIEQIYNLLTLDKWITDKTLQDKYLTEDLYPKLLMNLHLLYDTRFNEQSCKVLIGLIKDKFFSINSPQIYEELENINLFTIHNSSRYNIYDKTKQENKNLFLYCVIISQIYSKNDDLISDMVTKLEGYFESTETAIRYLAEIDYSSQSTIESHFKYALPNISKQSFDFLRALNMRTFTNNSKKELNKILAYFSCGHLLESHTDFKGLLAKYPDPNSLNDDAINDTISTIERILIKQQYQYEEEVLSESVKPLVKDLVVHAFEVLLNSDSFQRALSFLTAGKLKTEDNMPDINFEFKINSKVFTFKKLPIKDMRSFILGKYTYCCQSIGDKAESCIIDGMSKKNAGLYVVTNAEDQIRMQAYAWLGTNESLVFDSFECADTNEGKKLFIECIKELLKVLQEIRIGVGGGTPKIDALQIKRDVAPKTGVSAYSDSSYVYYIVSGQELQCINTTPNVIKSSNIYCNDFEEFKNYHKLVQFNLLTRTFAFDCQQLYYLINNGATTEMLVQMRENDFFYFKNIFIENRKDILDLIQNNVHIKDLIKLFVDIIDKLALQEFLSNKDIILLFSRYGMHIKDLANIYFDYRYKYDLFKKHITPIQYLLINSIKLQDLMDMYDKNSEKAALFIKNGAQIQYLLINGMKLQDLMDMYDKNSEKAALFIKNGAQIQYLSMSIDLSILMYLYNSKKENIKLIIRNGAHVSCLLKNGITLQTLMDMYDSSVQQAELFIKNGAHVSCLLKNGITLQTLMDMYNNSLEKTEFFIKSAIKIKPIAHLVSLTTLIRKYDSNPENIQLLIENAQSVRSLGKYIKVYDLITMPEIEVRKWKLFIKYTEQILWLVENNIYRVGYLSFLQNNYITFEDIERMYNNDPHKAELFIKNGRLLRLLTYNSNITISELMENYNQDNQKIEFLLKYGEQVLCLMGNMYRNIHEYLNVLNHYKSTAFPFVLYHGITLEYLMNIYDSNPQKGKLFIEYSTAVVYLIHNGLHIGMLSDMYDKNPEKVKLFIEYGEHVSYLIENGVTLQVLLNEYDKNPEKVKLFIEYGEHVSYLIHNGLHIGMLSDMYDKNPEKVKLFIEYGEHVSYLIENGVTLQVLLNEYDKNPEKVKLFMEYGDADSMSYLLYTFELSTLMDMYNSNLEKAEFLITHGEHMADLHTSGIMIQGLIDIYDRDVEKARFLAQNSDNIKHLTYYGIITVTALINMCEEELQKAKFFIHNSKKITDFLKSNNLCFDQLVKFYHHDKTIEEVMNKCKFLMKDNEQVFQLSDDISDDINVLVDMCYDVKGRKTLNFLANNYKKAFNLCNNMEDINARELVNICNSTNYNKAIEFFVKNDQQTISIINNTKLTFKELLKMYNNSEKFELAMKQAGKVISKISNTKVAFEELIKMCDDNNKKFKSFIKYTKEIISKTSNTKITFEELVKEYDSNILKDRKFKNSKQILDPKNNIYKYDSVDVSTGNKCNEELTPERDQVNSPQNSVEINIHDSHIMSCLKRKSSNSIEEQSYSIPNVPYKKIKFDIESITKCMGEFNFNDLTEI